ncbi:MAG: hypothetical protein ACLSHW_05655 [Lachnospiraceae bacterium]
MVRQPGTDRESSYRSGYLCRNYRGNVVLVCPVDRAALSGGYSRCKYLRDQDSFSLTANVRRLARNDQVGVAVHSENDWKLKSDKHVVEL